MDVVRIHYGALWLQGLVSVRANLRLNVSLLLFLPDFETNTCEMNIYAVVLILDIPSQEAYCVSKTKSPNKKILLSSVTVLCSFKVSVITV